MANLAPEIDLNGGGPVRIDYAEYDPIAPIAPAATAADPDSADFDEGGLTVAFTRGGGADDQLRIVGGDFLVEETDLYYQGVPIGTVTGGTDGSTPLVVAFNAQVDAAVAAALIRAVGYVNYSAIPLAGERVVTFTLADGDGGTSLVREATIVVAATDTAPVAEDDRVAADENAVATGSLFVDNGNGNDLDPDGILTISAVNGSAGNVGTALILDSGARLTVNADGTYSYDPNGRFNDLAAGGSGAVNTTAVGDVFTYTLAGGNSATVVVTVNGVASPGDRLMGDENRNDITGTEGADVFVIDLGGYDVALGLGGDDVVYVGGAMGYVGLVDGGEGYDTIVLQGDYGDGLFLRGGLYEIEAIALLAGSNAAFGASGQALNSYEIHIDDSHFAAGLRARINGSALLAGENFYFDGSAETDADFLIYGGRGMDWLRGGRGNDIFFFDVGRFAAGDGVEGGSGYDGLFLRGSYTLDFRDGDFLLIGIENITLTSAADERYARGGGSEFDYELILSNSIVGAGETLTVSGALLMATETMILDASQEAGGLLRLFGGRADDTLKGGSQSDLIHGNLGADSLTGNGGADTFRYDSTAESSSRSMDQILDFTPGTDKVDLSRIDADSLAVGDQGFGWIGSEAFSGSAGQLRAYEQSGTWFVEGDIDGDSVADFVIALALQGATPLGAGDFLL